MTDEAPIDRTLATLLRSPLREVLLVGLRHARDLPVPYYRPHLLAGFWLELVDGLVRFENDQGVLTAVPAARLEIPTWLRGEDRDDLCVISGDGSTLDPALDPSPITTLELIAEDDEALREAKLLAVYLRCSNDAELFANAWSFEGVQFGYAAEYARWRAFMAGRESWTRYRWEAAERPWTWSSRRSLALHP